MSGIDENSLLETVIVIPLSTYIEKDTLPYRYLITKREKLEQDNDACIYEIRALSKMRIK
jgi:mRNA interferase MazF